MPVCLASTPSITHQNRTSFKVLAVLVRLAYVPAMTRQNRTSVKVSDSIAYWPGIHYIYDNQSRTSIKIPESSAYLCGIHSIYETSKQDKCKSARQRHLLARRALCKKEKTENPCSRRWKRKKKNMSVNQTSAGEWRLASLHSDLFLLRWSSITCSSSCNI